MADRSAAVFFNEVGGAFANWIERYELRHRTGWEPSSPLKNVESSAFSVPLSSSSWADRVVVSAVG